MKKLLISSAKVVVLVFSIILHTGCQDKPGRPTKEASGEVRKTDPAIDSPDWRIDSLMKTHFATDGPGVVLALERDTAANTTGEKFIRRTISDSAQSFYWSRGRTIVPAGAVVTIHSVFNIGSLTKQFTAAAIESLAFEQKLSITDAIGKYLPGLPKALAKISIQQLLSHCSGIPDHYGFTDTNKVKHARDKDVLNAIRLSDTAYFDPGTHYRYSNTAYCLLGMIIEQCSGSPYENYLKKNILPRDTTETSVLPASSIIGDRVHGYEKDSSGHWKESDAPESIFFTTEADGGLLTSMKDYMSWCRSIEDNYQSPVKEKRGETILNGLLPRTLVDSAAGLYYGYGWFVLPRKSKAGPLIYHTGFNGGFRTSVLLIPQLGYRIAIFSASPGVDLEDLVHQINLILGVDDKGFIKSGPLES